MVLYSDNNASSNLLVHLPDQISEDVFTTLQIPSPKDATAETYKLNVKEYASFFRILFNASYLSNAWSEATLKLLSKVSFERGITGKLPRDLKVAHKFGERIYTEESPTWEIKKLAQLHDCGIVYYPGNPYLLCIMTRGNTLDELSIMTQDISKMIYDTVDATRKKAQGQE
jgi:beta-lactamase class A